MNRTFDDGFEARLGEFLLVAYAAGHEVENEWYLANTDSMIPDLVVRITRTNARRERRPTESEVVFEGIEPGEFKTELENILLTEFARGEHIDGTWTIGYGWADLPEWTVEIKRRDLGLDADEDQLRTGSSEDPA